MEPGDNPDETPILPVAAAKIRVGEAAAVGAGIAHQTLGAMGFTGEHILHRFTHRLWTWRDDFGSEAEWALRLGREMLARGVDDYWPALVDHAEPLVVDGNLYCCRFKRECSGWMKAFSADLARRSSR